MATVIDVTEGGLKAEAPISKAWIWSRLSFSFVNFLVSKGTKKELDHGDLPSLPEEDHASVVTDAFEALKRERAEATAVLQSNAAVRKALDAERVEHVHVSREEARQDSGPQR